MQFDLNLFLSTYNFSYECEDSNGLNDVLEIENERIIKRDSIIKDNARFNILLFELKYPVKIDNVKTSDNIMEKYYDTTVIIEYYDNEKKSLYTIYDVLYKSTSSIDMAEANYNELEMLLKNNDSIADIFERITKSIEK